MTYETDPALFSSNFEREANDRYFTEHWCTEALIKAVPYNIIPTNGVYFEPFCGRGDIASVIHRLKNPKVIIGNDIDHSDKTYWHFIEQVSDLDFFSEGFTFPKGVNAIVTNPPYNMAKEAIELCLDEMRSSTSLSVVAMLLRSEFDHAYTRRHLFERPYYMGKVVLTSRPRWDDWWNGMPPKSGPRHNFSWFLWGLTWTGNHPAIWYGHKK